MNRPINLLLILSSKQLPAPIYEVEQLAKLAYQKSTVLFATTRFVNGLIPGTSKITLYGDEELKHNLLATGIFEEFITLNSPEGESIANSDPLYEKEYPITLKGFIRLSLFELFPDNESIDSLNALLETGEFLKSDHPIFEEEEIPFGRQKNSIYYIEDRTGSGKVSASEQINLLECKRRELEDKVHQLASFWQITEDRRRSLKLESEQDLDELFAEIEKLKQNQNQRVDERLIIKIIAKLIRFFYPSIEFIQGSVETLVNRYHAPENVMKLLSDLNTDFQRAKSNRPTKKIQGTKNWYEYSAKKDCRVYFRRMYKSGQCHPHVYISEKKRQKQDIQLLKKYDD